jgi:hypothetical protein
MTLKLSKLLLWLRCFMAVILFAVAGSDVAVVWASEQAASVQVLYDAPANEYDATTGTTAHTEALDDVYDAAVDLGVGMVDARVPLVWREVPRGQTTVIGKVKDLENLRPAENTLLKHLPDQGVPKANWAQNSSVLRQEMAKGQPIRDASVNATGGLRDNSGFLRAERNLLETSGWTYDPSTHLWSPP